MKPGPEHVGMWFRDRETSMVWSFAGTNKAGQYVLHRGAAHRFFPADAFDAAWTGPIRPGHYCSEHDIEFAQHCPGCNPAAEQAAQMPAAVLSRLLAAGFEHAELCLVATTEMPTPSYRFIGYRGAESISYTLISDEPGALERVEQAAGEKLRALIEGERDGT